MIEELNDKQPGQKMLEERTEALTDEILTDFLHYELTSLKIAREYVQEDIQKFEESPEPLQRDTDYDLIKEIQSEPSPTHDTRIP